MKLKKLGLIATLSVASGISAATVSASTLEQYGFSDVVIFGDSLSDPVNNFGPPTSFIYPNDQVTNGDTWAVKLGYDDPSTNNFAVSGATAKTDGGGDFMEQIETFMGTNQTLGDSALAIVWLGGNDIANALFGDPSNAVNRLTEGVTALATGLAALATTGFDQALVFTSPDIGDTPLAKASGVEGAAFASILTTEFNRELVGIGEAEVAQGVTLNELIDLAFLDVPTLALEAKGTIDYTNDEDACFDGQTFVNGCDLANANGFFYYDPFHPTDTTHGFIAQKAELAAEQLAPVPLPAGFVLMGTVLAGFGFVSRRQRKQQA